MRRAVIRTLSALLMIAVLAMPAGRVSAARAAVPKGAPVVKTSTPWRAVIYSMVALAGICVVAFKDPRRTHLD